MCPDSFRQWRLFVGSRFLHFVNSTLVTISPYEGWTTQVKNLSGIACIGLDSRNASRSVLLMSTRRPTFCAWSCLFRMYKRIVVVPRPEIAAASFIEKKALSADAASRTSLELFFKACQTAASTIGLMMVVKSSERLFELICHLPK